MVQDWYCISPAVTRIFPAHLLLEAVEDTPLEMEGWPWRELGCCDPQKASGSGIVWVTQCRSARREVFGTDEVFVLFML